MLQSFTQSAGQNAKNPDISIELLLQKLDEAIDDIEAGRVQTIDDAWKEIDAL
ncbi:MAG: hypothetical protein IJM37_02185 [Lachnospiraceae bacterium]|nr:hypothetical protein [Lachnospiraceae bacterium]